MSQTTTAQATDVSKLLTSTETHYVQYDWVKDGDEMVLQRTVWTKRYRKTDRTIVHEETVARIPLSNVASMMQDIVQELVQA